MQDAGLDAMRCIESVSMVPVGIGVLRLLIHGVAVGVFIHRHCVVDWVEVTH